MASIALRKQKVGNNTIDLNPGKIKLFAQELSLNLIHFEAHRFGQFADLFHCSIRVDQALDSDRTPAYEFFS